MDFCQVGCFLKLVINTYMQEFCMPNFKKDNVVLLKVLRNLVKENIDASKVNMVMEQDVAEYITEMTDKRRIRKLKELNRALDKYIAEVVSFEKLKEQSAAYMEQQRKKTEEYYASDPSNRDQ